MPKRQQVRSGLVLVSFLLFPITIFYLSPVLIIQGAAEGTVSGSFLVFAALFVAALMLGRAFCGWVCPAGGMQDAWRMAQDRPVTGGWRNLLKWVIWAPWVATIAVIATSAGGFHRVDPLYQTFYGISIAEPWQYIIYYFFVFLIAGMAFLIGRRAFCHYICWMAPIMILGRRLSRWLRLPGLRLHALAGRCTGCRRCVRACPMSLNVTEMVQAQRTDNDECILCGQCADVCPRKALSLGFRTPAEPLSAERAEVG